ncbi:hypothetical protein E4U41_001662 [Claviceps citrina]|nr:hypothetical protein E4U41_001662 [Claviceps citrina]
MEADAVRRRISHWDRGHYSNLRRLLVLHKSSRGVVDCIVPAEEHLDPVRGLDGAVTQTRTRNELGATADTAARQAARHEKPGPHVASLYEGYCGDEVVRERPCHHHHRPRLPLPVSRPCWRVKHRQRRTTNLEPIINPLVGQIYCGYWPPERRHYAVIVLPIGGSFAPLGLRGSIASTKLLQCERRPCHTRHPDTGDYAWSHGFAPKDREFPVVWISDTRFPARAQYSWLEARHLSPLRIEKTPRQFWPTIEEFVRRRNRDGLLATDLAHPPANGAPVALPAVRNTANARLCAQIDAYFDNVVFVDETENSDPDFEMKDETDSDSDSDSDSDDDSDLEIVADSRIKCEPRWY